MTGEYTSVPAPPTPLIALRKGTHNAKPAGLKVAGYAEATEKEVKAYINRRVSTPLKYGHLDNEGVVESDEDRDAKAMAILAAVTITSIPKTFKQAMSSQLADDWYKAMNDEFNGLVAQGTWELVSTLR